MAAIIEAFRVSVGTTPVKLVDCSDGQGRRVFMRSGSNQPIFIGGPTVTVATGFPLPAGATLGPFACWPDGGEPYAVKAGPVAEVAVITSW